MNYFKYVSQTISGGLNLFMLCCYFFLRKAISGHSVHLNSAAFPFQLLFVHPQRVSLYRSIKRKYIFNKFFIPSPRGFEKKSIYIFFCRQTYLLFVWSVPVMKMPPGSSFSLWLLKQSFMYVFFQINNFESSCPYRHKTTGIWTL